MRTKNLAALEHTTLSELEDILNFHTLKQIPVDQWTAFSWSSSRHSLFETCKRQYYLNYYGTRRVREANNEVISALWWLKQGRSVKMWIGTVLHHVAQQAIQAHYDGTPLTEQALLDLALSYYRGGFNASKRGAKHDNQWIVLMEHLYPAMGFTTNQKEAEKTVIDLTRNFLHSYAYNLILSLPSEAVLEVDESFQSFVLRGMPELQDVRIFAIPDVVVRHDDRLIIIDWKTGDVERESIRIQAGVYKLYAHETYDVPPDAINVRIVDLTNGGEAVDPPGGTPSLDETRAFIMQSIAAMVEQMDYPVYNTVAITSFPMTDDLVLCQSCPFMRACWRHQSIHE
jgi:hypothetical protein